MNGSILSKSIGKTGLACLLRPNSSTGYYKTPRLETAFHAAKTMTSTMKENRAESADAKSLSITPAKRREMSHLS